MKTKLSYKLPLCLPLPRANPAPPSQFQDVYGCVRRKRNLPGMGQSEFLRPVPPETGRQNHWIWTVERHVSESVVLSLKMLMLGWDIFFY